MSNRQRPPEFPLEDWQAGRTCPNAWRDEENHSVASQCSSNEMYIKQRCKSTQDGKRKASKGAMNPRSSLPHLPSHMAGWNCTPQKVGSRLFSPVLPAAGTRASPSHSRHLPAFQRDSAIRMIISRIPIPWAEGFLFTWLAP